MAIRETDLGRVYDDLDKYAWTREDTPGVLGKPCFSFWSPNLIMLAAWLTDCHGDAGQLGMGRWLRWCALSTRR